MEKHLFVKIYGEAARMAGELFGMNPVVILAQGAIESGWGESVLAVKYHNLFGITGYGVANAYWHGGKTDLGKGGLCPADIFCLPPGCGSQFLPGGVCTRDCLQPVYQ